MWNRNVILRRLPIPICGPSKPERHAPVVNGHLQEVRGIEVGQIFKLGIKYSKALGATFLDEKGQTQLIVMGCYGIGVSRTMAAAIEQTFR